MTNTTTEIVNERAAAAAKAPKARADRLADRILLGAAKLAAFASDLTAEEWETPVSATDKRSIGVIVHHVGNMYPAEVSIAQSISRGTPVTDITWEVVAGINAAHAEEKASVTKEEAIEFLRRNSRDAADAIREFTDEQLDTAAAFGLSYDAPVTAQFVIEDHALRHSWHHLAKIRKALGK